MWPCWAQLLVLSYDVPLYIIQGDASYTIYNWLKWCKNSILKPIIDRFVISFVQQLHNIIIERFVMFLKHAIINYRKVFLIFCTKISLMTFLPNSTSTSTTTATKVEFCYTCPPAHAPVIVVKLQLLLWFQLLTLSTT